MVKLGEVVEKWSAEVSRLLGKEVKWCPLTGKNCKGKLCAWFIEGVGCAVLVLALTSLQGGGGGEKA